MSEQNTRTPTEILEELLDTYVPAHYVAAYREEFRQARQAERGLVSGLDESKRLHEAIRIKVRELRPGESIDADGNRFLSHPQGAVLPPSDPVPLSAPEQALADANPSTHPEVKPPSEMESANLQVQAALFRLSRLSADLERKNAKLLVLLDSEEPPEAMYIRMAVHSSLKGAARSAWRWLREQVIEPASQLGASAIPDPELMEALKAGFAAARPRKED